MARSHGVSPSARDTDPTAVASIFRLGVPARRLRATSESVDGLCDSKAKEDDATQTPRERTDEGHVRHPPGKLRNKFPNAQTQARKADGGHDRERPEQVTILPLGVHGAHGARRVVNSSRWPARQLNFSRSSARNS
jgi:hypothetical protein